MAKDNQIIVDISVNSKDVAEAENRIDKLTDSIEELGKGISDARKLNKEHTKSIAELNKKRKEGTVSIESHGKQVELLNSKIKGNNIQIAKSTVELQKQKRERTANIKLVISEKNGYEALSQKLVKLRKNAKDVGVQFGVNSKEFKNASGQVQKLDSKLKLIDNSLGQNQRSVGKYSNALKGLGSQILGAAGITGAVTMLIGVMKNAFKVFVDFQKTNSKLAAVLGLTSREINVLSNQQKELGATTAFTASQVGELQIELAKLGFSLKDIENSTPGILDLAAATGTDLASAAELAGATLRIFNLESSEMSRVTDVLAKSTSASSLSMEKLGTILPTVGKTAQVAGISLERTAALAGTLTDRGLDASTAATSLRNIFLDLSKKGITWDDAMKRINDSTDKNKTAMELFGKRSATTAIVLSETAISVGKLEQKLLDANGAAKLMADTMLDNLSGDVTKATSAWEGFILSVEDGEGSISSAIRDVVQGFSDFLGKLTLFNEVGIVDKLKLIANAALSLFEKAFLPLIGALESLGVEVPKFRFQVEKTTNALQLQNKEQTNSVRLTKEQKEALKKESAALETSAQKTKRLAKEKKKAADQEKKAAKQRAKDEKQKLADDKKFAASQKKLIALDNKRRLTGISNAKDLRDERIKIEAETLTNTLLNQELLGIEREVLIQQSAENIAAINQEYIDIEKEQEEEKTERIEAANETIQDIKRRATLSEIKDAKKLKDKLIEFENARREFILDNEDLLKEERAVIVLESANKVKAIEDAFADQKEKDDKERREQQKIVVETFFADMAMISHEFGLGEMELFNRVGFSISKAFEDGKVSAESALLAIAEISNAVFDAMSKRRAEDLADNETARDRALQLARDEAYAEVDLLDEQKRQEERIRLEALAAQGDQDAIYKLAQLDAQQALKDAEAAINAEFDKKNKEIKLKQWKADKAKTLLDIAMATALAVTKSIAASPITLGLPWSALVLALGIAQGAIVAAQNPPTFAQGTSDIVNIGGSHASGNDVDVFGVSGNQKQYFGKVEKGEAMPVIRKSAVNDYMVSQLNGKYSSGRKTFASGTPDITSEQQEQNNNLNMNQLVDAFSNIQIVAKIEDITKEAGKKIEIVDNSRV